MKARAKRIAAGIALAMAVEFFSAASTLACVAPRGPGDGIRRGGYDTVVIVEVTKAGYTRYSSRTAKPWEGIAQRVYVMTGQTDLTTFPIGRTGSSAACDDGIPPPKSGDFWILYLNQRAGPLVTVESLPIGIAWQADPVLRGQLSGF